MSSNAETITGYSCYRTYLALKMHFTSAKYDYHLYNGSVRASPDTFEKRKDKRAFVKIARMREPINFMIGNFIFGNPKAWVGNFNDEAWQKYAEWNDKGIALYRFKEELSVLDPDFKSNFSGEFGVPPIFDLYNENKISLFTLSVFRKILPLHKWYATMDALVLFEQDYKKLDKSYNFFRFDESTYKQVIFQKFN